MSQEILQDLVVESDHGARKPSRLVLFVIMAVALCWSLFQLWIASPLPFLFADTLNIPVLDEIKSRYIHLAFALFLAFISYPASKRSPRNYVPAWDWLSAVVSAFCCLYLLFNYVDISNRLGIPTTFDLVSACVGILLLIEATRRSLGPPLMIIALVFLFYTFAGSSELVPDIIQHKGASLSKVATHQWLSTEGVFGVALGVSASFVFLFVLFGSLLEKAGAGNYFIKLAFALLGHMRGGPAKAAVLASAMTGVISGSSIANVVTTGTFTIPLMRRVGFSREQAGAIEVAAGVDGQLMPPVMGAAAFLMAEYVGVPYSEIVKHAFLPAILSYAALLYMVHLEALKRGMGVIPKNNNHTLIQKAVRLGITLSSIIILSGIVYYGIGWIKGVFDAHAIYVILAVVIIIYVALLKYEAGLQDLEMDDPNAEITKLPEVFPTFKTGIHYLLPLVMLLWCLMVERFSPGLSAFYACAFMMVILVTQHPIKECFRKSGKVRAGFRQGWNDLFGGLIAGARNMAGIGVATAVAGIVVGTVSLTGIGQVLTEVVELISGGSVFFMLLLTALISLILGMGLPTTANYIVVASLMAKVIEELGAQNGLVVPLVAIHMFVFYFGIMADVTPPVGLAAFAAAAISGGDPIKTGIKAFAYSLRTAILPFLFIYDTELLMIGVDNVWLAAWIFIKALFAMCLFASVLQGYFIVRSKWYESLLLLVAMFMFLAPQFWINLIVEPYQKVDVTQLEDTIMKYQPGQGIFLKFQKNDADGNLVKRIKTYVVLPEGKKASERLEAYGLALQKNKGSILVEDVVFNSAAEKVLGQDFYDYEFKVTGLEVPSPQPSKRWMNIPAAVLFLCVLALQRRRKMLLGKR